MIVELSKGPKLPSTSGSFNDRKKLFSTRSQYTSSVDCPGIELTTVYCHSKKMLSNYTPRPNKLPFGTEKVQFLFFELERKTFKLPKEHLIQIMPL